MNIDVLVGLVHCAQDPQTSFFNNFFIKYGFHGTIYIFKNYFATLFLVFSFRQNKLYQNESLNVQNFFFSFFFFFNGSI